MKQTLTFLFIAMLVCFAAQGQLKQTPRQQADQLTKQMVKALSLSDAQKTKVAAVNLLYAEKYNALTNPYGKTTTKAKLKKKRSNDEEDDYEYEDEDDYEYVIEEALAPSEEALAPSEEMLAPSEVMVIDNDVLKQEILQLIAQRNDMLRNILTPAQYNDFMDYDSAPKRNVQQVKQNQQEAAKEEKKGTAKKK